MPAATKSDKETPLCVDLDGTLINTDMLWESLVRLLKRNPLNLVNVLLWWTRGRARLKAEIAQRVQVDPSTLPYNNNVIEFARGERASGRKVLLVTASDAAMAEGIQRYLPIFDEVLASDGKRNLRGKNKGATLAQIFGERGFDYAGNSRVDLPVWERSRKAIVVNGSPALLSLAGKRAEIGAVFPPEHRLVPQLGHVLAPLIRPEYFVVLLPFLWMLLTFQRPSPAQAMIALASFLLCTWGARIMNELFAIESDRQDPLRSKRPFASGKLNIHAGPLLGAPLVLAGLGLAVPVSFVLLLAVALDALLELLSPQDIKPEPLGVRILFWSARNALRVLGGAAAVAG